MARRLVRVFSRLTLACPICATPEGSLMSEGARNGALVLAAVTLVVIAPLAFTAVRLWRSERDE
jgi:hypothetical protein